MTIVITKNKSRLGLENKNIIIIRTQACKYTEALGRARYTVSVYVDNTSFNGEPILYLKLWKYNISLAFRKYV